MMNKDFRMNELFDFIDYCDDNLYNSDVGLKIGLNVKSYISDEEHDSKSKIRS